MKEKVVFMNGILEETPDGLWPYANRCKKCGKTFFPREFMCNECLGEEFEDVPLPREGFLDTYTCLYRKVNDYPKIPHCIGHVKFPDIRVMVMGMIDLPQEELDKLERGNEFKMKSRVEVFVDTLWEDEAKEYIGYKFRIVE